MKALKQKGALVVAGFAGASALLFALYRLWKHLSPQTPPAKEDSESSAAEEELSDEEEHIPFE